MRVSPAARRRRRLLVTAAAAAGLAGVAVGAGAGDERTTTAKGPGPSATRFAALTSTAAAPVGRRARPIPLDEAIGAHLISRMRGTVPSPELLRRVRSGKVGGVILFADNVASLPQVKHLTTTLRRAADPRPFVIAVDQEGGPVKRFAGLPPDRAPRDMTPAEAAVEGRRTAKALKSLGVTLDLAPLADRAEDPRSFLHRRTFADPRAICAFADALSRNGVMSTLKHFPGLDGAPANTDDRPVTLRRSRAQLNLQARRFRPCGDLVMPANATYPTLGPGPAVFERATYRLLGEDRPTISDDLESKALAGRRDPEVRALRAGLDLLLYAHSESAAARAHLRIRRAVAAGRLDAGTLRAGAEQIRRVLATGPA